MYIFKTLFFVTFIQYCLGNFFTRGMVQSVLFNTCLGGSVLHTSSIKKTVSLTSTKKDMSSTITNEVVSQAGATTNDKKKAYNRTANSDENMVPPMRGYEKSVFDIDTSSTENIVSQTSATEVVCCKEIHEAVSHANATTNDIKKAYNRTASSDENMVQPMQGDEGSMFDIDTTTPENIVSHILETEVVCCNEIHEAVSHANATTNDKKKAYNRTASSDENMVQPMPDGEGSMFDIDTITLENIVSQTSTTKAVYCKETHEIVSHANVTISDEKKGCNRTANSDENSDNNEIEVYGNQQFIIPAYEYIYPIILSLCLGTTLVFVYVLGKQFKISTPIGKATLVIFVAIAVADIFTIGSSLAEISYLYIKTRANSGYLPFTACKTMYILERLSAVPHAASVWFTVVLAIQRYVCVSNPFKTKRFVNVKSSIVCVSLIFTIVLALHIYRFFDVGFYKVTFFNPNLSEKPIETCHSDAAWVKAVRVYEEVFMWSRIVVAQFVPCCLIVVFVTLMVSRLHKKDHTLKQAGHDNLNVRIQRRQLSINVVVIALIVVGVELSSGIFLSFHAWGISTRHTVLSNETFQLAAFAFDIILYVSYFAIFVIYCLMSREIRKTAVSVFLPCRRSLSQTKTGTRSSPIK